MLGRRLCRHFEPKKVLTEPFRRAGDRKSNSPSAMRGPTPRQRTTGLCCHSWPCLMAHTCKQTALLSAFSSKTQLTMTFKVDRGILLFHPLPKGIPHIPRHVPVRYRVLPPDGFQSPTQSLAGGDEVNSAESCGGRDGQSPERGAVAGEALGGDLGVVCTTVWPLSLFLSRCKL